MSLSLSGGFGLQVYPRVALLEHCHEMRYCLSLAPLCFDCGWLRAAEQRSGHERSEGDPSPPGENLVAAVEEMPGDRFGYKPTPQQMSFAHLVLHMTESNNYLCAKAGDVPEPKAQELKETDGKDKLVAALKASFDFCNTAMPKVTDAKLGDTIEFWGGRKAPRAFALIALTNDWADHYSAAAMYLRLNGLLPPTANK